MFAASPLPMLIPLCALAHRQAALRGQDGSIRFVRTPATILDNFSPAPIQACMVKIKSDRGSPKLIWRISPEHPHGVFIPAAIQRSRPARSSEVHERGCCESSYELLNGIEVTETGLDTLPDEMADPFATEPGPP